MKRLWVAFISIGLAVASIPMGWAVPDPDTQLKIETLEKQMGLLKNQLDELKGEMQGKTRLWSEPKEVPRPRGESEDERKLNIAGELNFRYRSNTDRQVLTDYGLQFYEIELFMDANVNDYTSVFIEYPISHKNYLNPGNAWIDFHQPGELAGAEYTGLMIGNFSPRFGLLNYDDNQSWVYGGRTTTNTPLVRGKSIDSQTIRNRQIGVSAPIKLGDFLFEPGIYNGSGPIEFSGGADNDHRLDATTRLQYTLPNEVGLVGAGYWYAPKTNGATSNTAGTRWGGSGAQHVRDIERFALYFKYPNVAQATLPDLSLGGKPFMLYGEYIWGTHHANSSIAVSNFTQDFAGWYVETNVNILRDKLVGVFRYDYLDEDTDVASNTLMALTPALKWNILENVWLTTNYEYYFGGQNASEKDNDRVALELAVWY